MKAKGTEGKFGKATDKKVARAKKEGGVEKKRAVFAENMKKIAKEHEAKGMKKHVEKERVDKRHEAKGEKKHDRKERTDRKHESKGMKMHMGDGGKHEAVGMHEGRLLGMKKKG